MRAPGDGLWPCLAAPLGLDPSCVAAGVDECLVVAGQALGGRQGAAGGGGGGAALPACFVEVLVHEVREGWRWRRWGVHARRFVFLVTSVS